MTNCYSQQIFPVPRPFNKSRFLICSRLSIGVCDEKKMRGDKILVIVIIFIFLHIYVRLPCLSRPTSFRNYVACQPAHSGHASPYTRFLKTLTCTVTTAMTIILTHNQTRNVGTEPRAIPVSFLFVSLLHEQFFF